MTLQETILTAINSAFPDASAQLRRGRDVVTGCFCAGIGRTRQPSELGMGAEGDVTVRFLASAEPSKMILVGETVEIKPAGSDEWQQFRVATRYETGGAVRLGLETRFES